MYRRTVQPTETPGRISGPLFIFNYLHDLFHVQTVLWGPGWLTKPFSTSLTHLRRCWPSGQMQKDSTLSRRRRQHGQLYHLTLFTPYLENQNTPPTAPDVYIPILFIEQKPYYRLMNQKPIRKANTWTARQTQRGRIGSQETNQIHMGVSHMKTIFSEMSW